MIASRSFSTIARAATLAMAVLAALPATAAELLMLEQAGCAWCARFNKEIAPIYAKTEEGRLAPLRRVDIHAPWPDDLAGILPERFTPTFVLVEDGREIGRMRGYAGDEFFWVLLQELLEKLPQAGQNSG